AGEDDEALGRLHEADLAGVEVIEGVRDVEPRVRVLLVRELDVEAHGEAAALLRTAIRRLHHAGPAARDYGPAALAEPPRHLARLPVRRRVLADAGRAEEGHRRAVDLRDDLEAVPELVADPRDVGLDVAGQRGEQTAVVSARARNCGARASRACRARAARQARNRWRRQRPAAMGG